MSISLSADVWMIAVGVVGVIFWFARLEAMVHALKENVKDHKDDVGTKVNALWEKLTEMNRSLGDVSVGIARIEGKLESRPEKPGRG